MKMIWMGYVACMSEERNAQKGSVGNLKGETSLANTFTDKRTGHSQNIGKIQLNTTCLIFILLRCSYIIYLNGMFRPFHGPSSG
jgi:hypothetical protein